MAKWCLVCLAAVAMLGYVCDAQWGWSKPSSFIHRKPTDQKPVGRVPVKPVTSVPEQEETIPQKTKTPQAPQAKVDFSPPVTWEFPVDPIPVPPPTAIPDLLSPPPVNSVAAVCRESQVFVTVNRDMFGIGQLIQTADLTMGRSCTAQTDTNEVLIFESELQDCGSRLVVEEEELIYIFSFTYVPSPLEGTVIVRTSSADFTVYCHYPRKGNVSSQDLIPTWTPFSATMVAEEYLYFSVRQMNEDWTLVRSGEYANHYYLGEVIRIECSVFQYNHVPLRLHVDECVATLSPDANSYPRYEFINNYGCLMDSKIPNSRSTFMARPSSNKLRFQLEAFMFQVARGAGGAGGKGEGDDSMTIYLTCNLRATTDGRGVDDYHKACSFWQNGWREVLGEHGACRCCDYTCDGSGGSDPGKGQEPQIPKPPPKTPQSPQRMGIRTRRSEETVFEARVGIRFDVTNQG